jgi:hypothetical protein
MNHCCQAFLLRDIHSAVYQSLVTDVDTIKNAKADDR